MNFNFTKEIFFFRKTTKNLIMRTILLLFCSTIFSFTPIDIISQNVKVTITENKTVTAYEIFDIIQSQTDYKFIYRSDLFKGCPLITLNKGTIKVNDLLSKAISNEEFDFNLLKNNTIVIEKEVSRIIQETITGNVTDENKVPLSNVTIRIKGTRKGLLTDFDGNFSVPGLKTSDVLIFSSVGFVTQSIKIGDKKVINVVLKESDDELDEIVVVSEKTKVNTGYQTVSKAKSVGAYESVGAEVIETKFQTNILERIEGTISGLTLYRGKPVIRGISTLFGEDEPLIVLDNVIYEGTLESINPNDIENVTVLKDATAAAIYGVRAANGVIVITTKKGILGKPRISYSSSFQVEELQDRSYQNLMSSAEFVDYQIDVFNATANGTRQFKQLTVDEVNTLLYDYADGLISEDYLNSELNTLRNLDGYDQVVDELLAPRFTQQHNLSLRGGSEKHQYALSLNYSEIGTFEKDRNSERLGVNVKNYFKLNDWFKFDISLIGSYSFSDNYIGITGLPLLGSSRLPYEVLRDEDGNPAEWKYVKSKSEIDRLISLGLIDQSYYPLNELKEQTSTYKSPSITINVGTQIKLSKSLELQLTGQKEISRRYSKLYSSENSYAVRDLINNATQIIDDEIINNIPHGGRVFETYYDNNSYTLRAQLNYNKLFNKKHDVKVLVGGERRQVIGDSYGDVRYGYDDTTLSYIPLDWDTLSETIQSTQSGLGTFTVGGQTGYQTDDSRYVSAYGNVSYMFDDKLGFNVSARIDESNLFGTSSDHRYKPLWSFGSNYIVDTESLAIPWLNKLKIRATYGISGNIYDGTGPEAIANLITTPNPAGETQASIVAPPNEELRWEQTYITNIGIDYELFSKKITGSVEFYDRTTIDAVARIDSDPILGWTQLPKNYASLNNRGIEFQIHSQFINTQDFRWDGKVVFSYNRNIVTEYTQAYNTFYAYDFLYGNQLREGQALNTVYTLRYAGLNEKGAPRAYKADGTIVDSYSDLVFEDLIDQGTNDPPYHASYFNNISYKQFDLSFMLIYYGGHVQRDVAAGYYPTYKNSYQLKTNLDRIHLNYWKEPGDEEDIYTSPAIHWDNAVDNPDYVRSSQRNIWTYADIHVQKADYMKVRNITLAYRVSQSVLDKMNLSNLRLSFDVRNPFLWANNRNNLDPEVWTTDRSRGNPKMPTYTLGINLNF